MNRFEQPSDFVFEPVVSEFTFDFEDFPVFESGPEPVDFIWKMNFLVRWDDTNLEWYPVKAWDENPNEPISEELMNRGWNYENRGKKLAQIEYEETWG